MKIESIADHLGHVQTVARWHWDEWGHADPGGSLASWTAGLAERVNRDRIPAAFLALDGDAPIGSAVLVEHDMDTHMELSPWLAGLYVLPHYRRAGVGAGLVEHAMSEASRFGVETLFLHTVTAGSAVALYEKLGWQAFAREHYEGEEVVLMSAALARHRSTGPAMRSRAGGEC